MNPSFETDRIKHLRKEQQFAPESSVGLHNKTTGFREGTWGNRSGNMGNQIPRSNLEQTPSHYRYKSRGVRG